MTDIGATFRALHVPGNPFILANVWDAGTAKLVAHLGAKALATSSAAHAYVLGRTDGGTLSRDDALAHAQEIVAATPLPVQGDFENGFGDDPETCAETVRLAAEVGLAGICIEDIAFPGLEAYDFALSVERIKAAASAARALPRDFVLTARADGIMMETYDLEEAVRRLQALETAGADCLYAPLPKSVEDHATLIKSVTKPVNVLWSGDYVKTPKSTFAEMGAARISIGASLARVTQRAIYDATKQMLDEGKADLLAQNISGDEIDRILAEN